MNFTSNQQAPAKTRNAGVRRGNLHAADGGRPGLQSPGSNLDLETRGYFEPRFGCDFRKVRIHTDHEAVESARAANSVAYASGFDLVFNRDAYSPHTIAGRRLLGHELAHVVQQTSHSAVGAGLPNSSHEDEAKHAASNSAQGKAVRGLSPVRVGQVQRVVEMRDVGRGEQSGFGRLPELIERLNAVSRGLTFSMQGNELHYAAQSGGRLSNFDTQMQGFIDQTAVIPLRLTNRHGLLGSKATGFHDQVQVDAWSSGYVDIDDLLASSDLGLESALVHFLRERTATTNYARRIGSASMDFDAPGAAGTRVQTEFNRAHAQGLDAELQVLRDFFSDPSIRLISAESSGDVARLYRNSQRDHIRTRVREGRGAQAGVDAVFVDVVTRDGKTHTPEEYLQILEAQRVADQVHRERLGGATEHSEAGRRVPAP